MAGAVKDAEQFDQIAETVEMVKAELRELKALRASADQEVKRIDRAVERAERVLAKVQNIKPRRRPREGADLDPHVQAGHARDDMLRAYRRAQKPLTQAEAAARANVGSGTSTWAIRALLEDKMIEPTGERRNRSNEFRYIGPRNPRGGVLGPRKGDTTLEPGQ